MIVTYFITTIIIIFILCYLYNKNIINSYINQLNSPTDLSCKINPKKTKEGLEYLKTKKIIVCGLLRNGEKNIEFIKQKTEVLSNLFNDYKVLVVENDSSDNTREELLKWVEETDHKVTVLGCGENSKICKLKFPETIKHNRGEKIIRKMVNLRNIYLDYINNNKEFDNFDFVAVWDIDLQGSFYVDGLASCGYLFKTNPIINGLCANGTRIYNLGFRQLKTVYDPYALVKNNISELDDNGSWYKVRNKVLKCSNDSNARKVKSCFNGFMIYRRNALKNKKYTFKQNKNGESICEHVTLNYDVDNIYINPALIFSVVYNP